MSERRLRSGSVGGEGQRRGIIRLSSQRSTSLLVDDVDHASTVNQAAPPGVTAGNGAGNGTGATRRTTLPIPTLQHLAREALLYGLADGHPVRLSRVVRGEMNDDEVMLADPISMPSSCRSDDDDDNDDDDCEHPMHPMQIPCIPVSTALLYDPSFWSGLISEAARRRLLSDEFLISLCESGIPPAQLELRGGLTDVAVTDRFLVKAPKDVPGQGMAMSQQTFGSASEMLISSLHRLRLSGGSERASSDMAVERLVGANDLETFLHRLSRSAADLESLTLGPSLLQHELSNTWIGSIKGISSFCTRLRSLELHGLAFGGTGRSDSGSSIGGTTAPSSISSLFEALARNCQTLEQLSLARSSGIQDRHLQSLLLELRDGTMSCPNLKDLDLSYTGVGPLAFSALCSRQLGYLGEDGTGDGKGIRKLCLDGTGVDHSWLKRILSSLPRLEDLSILHCSNLEAGPEIWDILATSSCNEMRSHLSSLAVELWFCSDEICHIATASNDIPVDQHYDDHEIALAAQYDEMNLEDSLAFLPAPDNTVDNFISDASKERGWSCRHCTLINESQANRCVACYGRRYPYPHSPAKDEGSADDSFDDIDDIDFDRKQASLYTFPRLERHPLRSFSAILHLVRDEDESDTTDREVRAQAATALSQKIINALPEKLFHLGLSLCSGDDGALLSHGCILNSDLASSMLQLHGTTLQELELKSIRFDVPQKLHDMCVGFKELRILKLFSVREFGVTAAEVLRLFSASGDRASAIAGFPNLEILQICVADDITRISSDFGTGTVNANGEDDDQGEVCFRSPYLKRLWLEGCNDIVKLDLVEVPCIERLSLVNCGSLSHLGISGPNEDDGFSTLQRLRISGTNLSPYSIASFKLPHLTKLVLEGMAHNEDWELAKMMEFSSESLTELRIKHCRLLGDYQQWCPQSPTCTGPDQSLSVLELFRPSESFDVINFQKLFVSGKLRDLSIREASGLQGDIYGLATASMSPSKDVFNVLGDGLPKPVGGNLLGVVPTRNSFGGGAIDETSSLAATEMLGGRAIERILLDFIETSRNGGSDEYGFPPTLNAFQRKLVHEHAEVLNLEHESVRLNSGVKVVRVRRRTTTEAADLFEEGREATTTIGANNAVDTNEAAAVTPEQQRRAQVNVESQTVPSNLERALLAASTSPPQVTFAADIENCSASEDVDSENDSENEDSDASSNNMSNDDGGEATPATPLPPRVRARSRRELRKAKQAAKRGEVYQFKDAGEDGMDQTNASDNENDGIDDDTNAAFDPLLQQERFARFDPKALRRLIGLAHKLPVDSNGTAVCVRYLRGACPYQHSKNGGQCRYAHFDVKASTAKKFAPLMDYVCGAAARPSVGGKGSSRRKSRGSRRSNEEIMLGASYESNPGSYNSDVSSANLMDVHVGSGGGGRAGGRRRRRKGSVGNEEDALASEDGLSSRGSSLGRSWQRQSLFSSSPRTASAFIRNGGIGGTPRLDLKRLVRLEITRCENLTGAHLNAPCLVRLGIRRCSCLRTLDLIAPRLTTLDVSESFRLEEFPLHDDSLRGLRVANLNGCKALNEAFCSRLVNHCRALRQLYIFGSGASEKASNTKIRTRTKTKTARLAKLTAGRPKLTLVSTKMQLKNVQAKREEVGERGGGFVEEADGGLLLVAR